MPPQPFLFLKSPREIRGIIIFLRPLPAGHWTKRDANAYLLHEPCKSSLNFSLTYWGTEKSTRLFRVNRQVSAEALERFY